MGPRDQMEPVALASRYPGEYLGVKIIGNDPSRTGEVTALHRQGSGTLIGPGGPLVSRRGALRPTQHR
ncbi:hypothetical protein GCM10009772_05510 [Pseudonocardia alni subsp. carboxydivorans]